MTYKEFASTLDMFVHLGGTMDDALDSMRSYHRLSKRREWLFWKRMLVEQAFKKRWPTLQKIGRVAWGLFLICGLVVFGMKMGDLIDTTIYKNQTEVARNVVYVCGHVPELCDDAAQIAKRVMK